MIALAIALADTFYWGSPAEAAWREWGQCLEREVANRRHEHGPSQMLAEQVIASCRSKQVEAKLQYQSLDPSLAASKKYNFSVAQIESMLPAEFDKLKSQAASKRGRVK